MQIKASEFTELIMREMKRKKKRNDSGDICSDTIVKPVHTNPDIFKSAFMYIFHMNQPFVLYSVHT